MPGGGATPMNNHAIVIGASMAGLLATRVLSDHFKTVTLVERDLLPEVAEQRRGVPQGRHTHGLLASGRQVLDDLFPGFSLEAIEKGGLPGDIVRDCRWFFQGDYLARPTSGLDGLLVSRPFLEQLVRSRVRALRNVTIRQHWQVEGLTTTAAAEPGELCITGIKIAGCELSADLVVDASGRGSRAPQWLAAMGYGPPAEERVSIDLRYTTRLFRRVPSQLHGDFGVIIPPTPTGKRGGVMLAQEGHRWTATLIGHFGNQAPEDLAGFVEYARTIPHSAIYDVVRRAQPIGDASTARFPASLRRRYERLRRFPENYLVMGDSVCSFNPIYGQGMSVAALEAMALDGLLEERPQDLRQQFFSRIAKLADIPWSIAVGNDLRMPEATGPRGAVVSVINAYMARLHRAAQRDPVLSIAFHRVANLLDPPHSLFHPAMALRVLRGGLRPRHVVVDRANEQDLSPLGGRDLPVV
jgi:2-polyprenyl-6-methoxyphenol hydroxylase-like FAD-dependent oxidoreductase